LVAISKQKVMRKLNINLRWCPQVTDEWMESLAKALPDCLHSIELWVMGCHQLTNVGLNHVMQNLKRCSEIYDIKLYAEGTGFTNDHEKMFHSFMNERA